MQALYSSGTPSSFQNLVHFKLTFDYLYYWNELIVVLENSPNLQSLLIDKVCIGCSWHIFIIRLILQSENYYKFIVFRNNYILRIDHLQLVSPNCRGQFHIAVVRSRESFFFLPFFNNFFSFNCGCLIIIERLQCKTILYSWCHQLQSIYLIVIYKKLQISVFHLLCVFFFIFITNNLFRPLFICWQRPLRERKEGEKWRMPESVAKCVSSELRICQVRGFEGQECELEFARYILKNASVLQTLRVCSVRASNYDAKLRMLKKLSSYPRTSATCQLLFEW